MDISHLFCLFFVLFAKVCLSDETSIREAIRGIEKDHYIHYDELSELLSSFEKAYPGIAKLHSIGKSVEGRDLWAFQISDNVADIEAGEPMFKYIGNVHGNEGLGRQMLIYFIEYLLTKYESDKTVSAIVDSTNIYIMPSMNPDGFEHATEGDCTSIQGRSNANDVDLNRNFPDQYSLYTEEYRDEEDEDKEMYGNGDNKPIQPETKAMIDWIQSNKFVLSASFHGGLIAALYPYDDSPDHNNEENLTPDDDVFKQLAQVYAYSHPEMKTGENCGTTIAGGVTNGAAFSEVVGRCGYSGNTS